MSDKSEQNIDELVHKQDQGVREMIALGVEAKKFLTSDLARYITNSAEAIACGATEKLKVVNPSDTAEIMKLQNIIKRFDHYEACLQELVAAGDSAYQMYLQSQESE